jgi:phosphoglycolate phosphatase
MTTCRLIVFDLDGTLVDSRRDLAESANIVLTECGGVPLPEDAIGRMVGDGAAALVKRAFEAARCPQPPGALERFLAVYNGRLLAFTRAYDGVNDVLRALAPRAPLAVLTNKPLAATRQILSGLCMSEYFSPDRVVGGDGPFPRKPDPAGLQHLIVGAGAAPAESVLVGDSIIDWRTARAAGARMCLASYGFGSENFPADCLDELDWVIKAPAELVGFL